ncbi:MAG: hypothetical protein J6V53_03000 [Alphaproteobacteria bacterium]|nr:hypothetical protein [Alphaproteobacteria bacterium]
MNTKTLTSNTQENFWNDENKSALQKNLNDIFAVKPLWEQKIVKEGLALQGLALIGALMVHSFMNDSSQLNKNLVFLATALSSSLAYLRMMRKKEVLKETLSAIGIFSFFGEQTTKTNQMQEKINIIKASEPILTPDYAKVYKTTKRMALLSGVALGAGYYFDKIALEAGLLASIAILGVCNAYDLLQAKSSVKRIAKALPKGVKLPCIENQRG